MRLGRWELVRPLGRGGMGEVWLARGPDGEEVALKRLLSAFEGDALLRFQREAETLLRLRDPGVVTWRDAGRDESGRPWIALELVRGGTLAERVAKSGPLPAPEAVAIALDLCRALAAVHGSGVLHRDLKPGNVLLDEAGRPKLADFGLARPTERGRSLTETGTIMGSPGYMAPEQVTGAKEEVGPATDVYGLGATLYHLLTGEPPFTGRTVMECLEQILHRPAAAPSRLRPEVPPALDAVVIRCLAKSPAERYASARALQVALGACLIAPARRGRRGLLPLVAIAVAVATVILAWLVSTARIPTTGVAGTVSAPASSTAPIDPRRLADQARAAWRAGRYDLALELADALLDHPHGDHVTAHLVRAQALAYSGVGSAAVGQACKEALARVSDPAQRAFAIALRAVLLQAPDQREHLDRAVNEYPDADASFWRGFSRQATDPEGALSDFSRAIELDPRHALAWFERGTARASRNELQEAVADYDQTLLINPRHRLAYVGRAGARGAQGDHASATEDYDRAIELGVPAHANRGVARAECGQLAGAIEDFTRAIELEPGYSAAYQNRARAREQLGQLAEAIADYTRVLELDSDHVATLLSRGGARHRQADYDGALQDFTRATKLEPGNVRAHLGLGDAHGALREHQEAIEAYSRVIDLAPDHARALYQRGMTRLGMNDRQGAREDLRRASAIKEESDWPQRARHDLEALPPP